MASFSDQLTQMLIKIKLVLVSCHYPYCTDEETEAKYEFSLQLRNDIMGERKPNTQNFLASSPIPPEPSTHPF